MVMKMQICGTRLDLPSAIEMRAMRLSIKTFAFHTTTNTKIQMVFTTATNCWSLALRRIETTASGNLLIAQRTNTPAWTPFHLIREEITATPLTCSVQRLINSMNVLLPRDFQKTLATAVESMTMNYLKRRKWEELGTSVRSTNASSIMVVFQTIKTNARCWLL